MIAAPGQVAAMYSPRPAHALPAAIHGRTPDMGAIRPESLAVVGDSGDFQPYALPVHHWRPSMAALFKKQPA